MENEYSKSNSKENKKRDDLLDPILRGALERYLETIIVDFIDFGLHLIARKGLRKPTKYREIPAILYESNIIDYELMKIFDEIIGFRHVLAYVYRRVDLDKLFWTLGGGIKDLKKLLIWAEKVTTNIERD
ncbi:MAG: type VII toxin-antitoxin system HepT family RNase toxin [Candidatus Asgardarchaeia archaeon]